MIEATRPENIIVRPTVRADGATVRAFRNPQDGRVSVITSKPGHDTILEAYFRHEVEHLGFGVPAAGEMEIVDAHLTADDMPRWGDKRLLDERITDK